MLLGNTLSSQREPVRITTRWSPKGACCQKGTGRSQERSKASGAKWEGTDPSCCCDEVEVTLLYRAAV